MAFEDAHVVRQGDTLAGIAKEWGHDNPGPVWGYPGNRALFAGRSPNLLRPGERVLVPYRPDLLRKIIATSTHLISEIVADAQKMLAEQDTSKKSLEAFLFKVDAANFLAGLGVGIASLVAQGAKGTAMTSKEALVWLAESRLTMASNVTTMSVPAPEAPRRDFKFWVRHTLGPWNPSYWASVYTAVQEGDVDIYLYGADATTYRTKMDIKRRADADIERLRQRISEGQAQLSQPYYRQRI